MKILVCLLATACVCNATLLSLLAGKESGHDQQQAHRYYNSHDHSHYHGHGFHNSPEVINVILDRGHSGAHVGAGSYSYASGHDYDRGSDAQLITTVHVGHGYSASNNLDYATSAGGFNSFSSQFDAILPHILQLILEGNAGGHGGGYIYGAGGDLNSQLAAHFGHSGQAFITRIHGKPSSYYSSGQVLQKGVLQITPIYRPPTQAFSSHGPPVQGW